MINNIKTILDNLNIKENFNKIFLYFDKNKEYLPILIRQLEQLSSNVESINALLNIDNIYDAYSIYRKFLETYFVIMSVLNNPKCIKDFVKHNELQRRKLFNREDNEIKDIFKNNIDGFIEHGYILPYLDKQPKKLSMFDVAKFGKALKYFNQYKICNQFVHNNLTSVKIDETKAKKELIDALDDIQSNLLNNFRKIYK